MKELSPSIIVLWAIDISVFSPMVNKMEEALHRKRIATPRSPQVRIYLSWTKPDTGNSQGYAQIVSDVSVDVYIHR